MTSLQEQFGDIETYLFDQILRGSILPAMKIFDAGCGASRNIVLSLGPEEAGMGRKLMTSSEVVPAAMKSRIRGTQEV